MAPDDLDAAWVVYLNDRTKLNREPLLVHYVHALVRPIALRMAKSLPQVSDAGSDFQSFGVFGLIDAMDRFDPEYETRFETFAGPRIRGAILDELRALDWVPRGMRAAGREVERVEERLINDLGRMPTPAEVEEVVGRKAARQSIAKLHFDNDPPECPGMVDHGQDLESGATVDDVVERAANAIGVLEPRLKAVAALAYVEGYTLTQIGKLLGVSESRVCQLQGQFLRELSREMAC
jgi:RNA polymerase sigma factor for flagellar operon FliA